MIMNGTRVETGKPSPRWQESQSQFDFSPCLGIGSGVCPNFDVY